MAGDKDILIEGELLSLRLRELRRRITTKEATKQDIQEYNLKMQRKKELESRILERLTKIREKKFNTPPITKKVVKKIGDKRIKTLKAFQRPKRPL